jgi:hypothetical protein
MAYTTIDDPSAYFQVNTYTGNGTSQSITFDGNSDLQPDFTWFKVTTSSGDSHVLLDSTRGTNKYLHSDSTAAETTSSAALTSFDIDGVTVGSYTGTNQNTDTIVNWSWKANAGSTSSNTDGTITSTVQVNTDAGFSIVTYTGNGGAATLGHGLGVKPNWIIVKSRSNVLDWEVYHSSLGATRRIRLNTTGGDSDQGDLMWNDTEPTTSVFSIGNNDNVGGSGKTYIAYCFASKQGFSKFGKYTGNGSANGPFVYTGFKPAYILIKATAGTQSWYIEDNKRGFNGAIEYNLLANSNSGGTTTSTNFDILSNGFKFHTTFAGWNASGVNYIYMAFAENPFVTSTGIPTTAR